MSANIYPDCSKLCNKNRTISLTDKSRGRSNYIVHNPNLYQLDCYIIDKCLKTK